MDLDPLEMVATTQAIAAAGGKPARVVRAPIGAARESKRGPIIDAEEADLESNMATLEEGTRAKNREFQAHLDAIKERGVRWEAKPRAPRPPKASKPPILARELFWS